MNQKFTELFCLKFKLKLKQNELLSGNQRPNFDVEKTKTNFNLNSN